MGDQQRAAAGIAGAATLGDLTSTALLEVAAVAGIVAVLSLAQNVLEQTTIRLNKAYDRHT